MEDSVTPDATIYGMLTTKFEDTYTREVSGVSLEYITGEQCTSRLNEVLGIFNWSFEVIEQGIHAEADEAWVLGQLTVWNPLDHEVKIVRQQYGSQKLARRRADSKIIDIGFDLKGASTDALKKTASLIGVGLYLSKKETHAHEAAASEVATSSTVPPPSNGTQAPKQDGSAGYVCEQCGEELKEIRFRDGTVWTPGLLASYGQRKHNKVLCMQHYRDANTTVKALPSADPATIEF